jgi:multidrug efflux system membrane fusion protein
MTSTVNKVPDLKIAPQPAAPRIGAPEGGNQDSVTPQSEPAAARSLSSRIIRGIFQLLLPFAVIAAGVGGYKYLKATKPEAPKRLAKPTVYAVRAVPVSFADVRPQLSLYGTTVAGRKVEIRSLVAGQVVSTSNSLRDGGTIPVGETILSIDPFNFEADLAETQAQKVEATAKIDEYKAALANERSNLVFAKEQVKLARTDLARAEPLSRRGTVSKRTVDDRRLTVSQRRQAISLIENNVKVWQARIVQQHAAAKRLETSTKRAAQRLAETRLKAPFNAYVTDVGAQVGRMLGVNDRVATLIDRDWIEIAFTVTDRQFGRLVRGKGGITGRAVEVRWNVGDKPIIYQAKIDRVGASVSSAAGGVQVYARVENPADGVGLRPGAFVELRVPGTEFADVARLPSAAVFNGDTVYVISKGKLAARKIAIVSTSGADVLVRGNVKPGEKVMSTRLSLPGDGVRVKVIASEPGGAKPDGVKNVN